MARVVTPTLKEYDPTATAWHRNVGVEGKGLTPTELLQAADLDWGIGIVNNQYTVNGQTFTKGNEYTAYREDRPEVCLGTYKSRKAWQNRPTVETFYDFCEQNGLTIDTIGSIKQGQSFFMSAKIGEIAPLVDVGDTTNYHLVLFESHMNGVARSMSLHGERLWCSNGCTMPVKLFQQKDAHVGKFDADILGNSLARARAAVLQEQDVMNGMTKQNMTFEEAYSLLMSTFCPPNRTKNPPDCITLILDLFMGKGYGSDSVAAFNTAYGLLQAVTEFFNHHAHARGEVDSQLQSIITPGGRRYKDMAKFRRNLETVITQRVDGALPGGSDAIRFGSGMPGSSGVINVPVGVGIR